MPQATSLSEHPDGRIDLRSARVLVTGGAGFIGSHLVDALALLDPSSLVVVDNFFLGREENLFTARSRYPGLVVEHTDAANMIELGGVFERHAIDVVFDLATVPLPYSLEHPLEAVETNIALATNLAELARLGAYRTLVHFSSSEVYGSANSIPMREDHPIGPATPYAAGKAGGDHVVRSYITSFGIDATIIRPFNNYGPRQNDRSYAGVIPIAIARAMRGEPMPIFGDGEQTRDYIYVEDTVRGTIMAYEHSATRGSTVNLATGEETTVLDLVRAVYGAANAIPTFEHLPCRLGDVRRHLGSGELAYEVFGFMPSVDLNSGMAQTLAWYRDKAVETP